MPRHRTIIAAVALIGAAAFASPPQRDEATIRAWIEGVPSPERRDLPGTEATNACRALVEIHAAMVAAARVAQRFPGRWAEVPEPYASETPGFIPRAPLPGGPDWFLELVVGRSVAPYDVFVREPWVIDDLVSALVERTSIADCDCAVPRTPGGSPRYDDHFEELHLVLSLSASGAWGRGDIDGLLIRHVAALRLARLYATHAWSSIHRWATDSASTTLMLLSWLPAKDWARASPEAIDVLRAELETLLGPDPFHGADTMRGHRELVRSLLVAGATETEKWRGRGLPPLSHRRAVDLLPEFESAMDRIERAWAARHDASLGFPFPPHSYGASYRWSPALDPDVSRLLLDVSYAAAMEDLVRARAADLRMYLESPMFPSAPPPPPFWPR